MQLSEEKQIAQSNKFKHMPTSEDDFDHDEFTMENNVEDSDNQPAARQEVFSDYEMMEDDSEEGDTANYKQFSDHDVMAKHEPAANQKVFC